MRLESNGELVDLFRGLSAAKANQVLVAGSGSLGIESIQSYGVLHNATLMKVVELFIVSR